MYLVEATVELSIPDLNELLKVSSLETAYLQTRSGRLIHEPDALAVHINGKLQEAAIESTLVYMGHVTQVYLRVRNQAAGSWVYIRVRRLFKAGHLTEFAVDQQYCDPKSVHLSDELLVAAFVLPKKLG